MARASMLGPVNPGNRAVSISFLTFAVLMAGEAGREHEPGTGAVRVAPELLANHSPRVQSCSQPAAQPAELEFGMLEADDIDTDLPRLLATGAREVVDFEWNETTGELSFSTTASSAVFSDLGYPASQAAARQRPNCE